MDSATLEHCATLQVEAARHYPKAMDLDELQAVASDLHEQLRQGRAGTASFAPGNGSQIDLVITDLGALGRNRLGGRYLVSIPNFYPARMAVTTLGWGPRAEDLVAGDLSLLLGDAYFVAIVLSLLADLLQEGA